MGSNAVLVEVVTMSRFRSVVLISCVLAATPAFAQVDFTGTWQRVGANDNGAAREPVDLLGMPLSADGRAKALSYDIAAQIGRASCRERV